MKSVSLMIISLILAVSLLGGCGRIETSQTGNGSSIEGGKGRYIEQDWDASYLKLGLILGYWKTDKENLRVYATNYHRISSYNINTEGQVTSEVIEWDGAARELLKTKIINYITISPSEEIYMITLDLDTSNGRNYGLAKVEGSEIKEIPIAWKKQMTNQVSAMEITENNELLILEAGRAVNVYDLNTNTWKKEIGGAAIRFFYEDGKIYEANIQNSSIEVYDLASEKCLRSITSGSIDAESWLVEGDEAGSLYLVNKEGISYLSQESDIWEQVVMGTGTSFAYKEIYGVMNIDDTIFAAFADTEAWVSYKKYVYDETVPAIPETQVTIFSLNDNATLKEAVNIYATEHPEVEVIFNIATKDNESMSTTDMIRTLNTQLLTGQGADIIVLDGLPIEAYMEKGILVDLNEYMEKEVHDKSLLTNMIDSYAKENKQYAVPLRFSIPVIMGAQEVVERMNSIEDIAAYQKAHPDSQLLTQQTADELMKTFFSSSKVGWFNEKGEVNKDQIKSFLEAVKSLASDESKAYQLKSEAINSSSFTDPTTESADYLYKRSDLMITRINTPISIQYLGYIQSQREGSVVKQWGNTSEQSFYTPNSIVGINSASRHKEVAAEILKIALSKKGQINMSLNNLPINREVLQYNVRGNNKASAGDVKFTLPDEKWNALEVVSKWGNFDLVLEVEKMCKAANTPENYDESLYQILYDAAKDYLLGNGDLDKAVEQFAANSKVYFSE